VIEHFTLEESRIVLSEMYRVLIENGTVEVHCPDLLKIIHRYQTQKIDEYTGLIFNDYLLSLYIYGKQDYSENLHKQGFTFNRLSNMLEEAGFKNIKRLQSEEDSIEMRVMAWK
jgi:predicted SAM-dependent methyltransferase